MVISGDSLNDTMGAQKRLKFLFSFIFLGTRSVWYCNSVELSSASNAEIPFEQMRYEKAEMACNKVPPIKSDKAIFLLNNENNTRYQTGGKNHDNIAQELYNDNPKYEVTTAIVDQLKDVELESGALPKIIWMLWDKGWDQANSDHRLSKISWAVTNPEFKILGLNMEEAEYLIERPKYFADEFWQGTTVQTKSDIIRIMLLSKYGGVWADASTFCRNPLRSWVDLEKNQDMVSFIRTDYANLDE